MSDERWCETCAQWQPPVHGCMRMCIVFCRLTGPADRCEDYCEADVPFTDDAVGSDAELQALVRGEA